MEAELKQHLDDMRRELVGRLEAGEARLMERLAGRIDAAEERIKDFVREADRDLETKVVGEFWKWGRTSDMRTRQAITDTALLGERMLAVEDRLSALERSKAS